MFERFETWYFDQPAPSVIYPAAWKAISEMGYPLTATSSYGFQGKSVSPKWGLHRLVEVAVMPWNQGATLQIRFRAAPTDEGLAVGVVGAIVFFPVAVVGGAISWEKYDNDWQETRTRLWNSLLQSAGAKPSASTPPPPAPAAPPPPPAAPTAPPPYAAPPAAGLACGSCKAPLPAGSKFCNSCGTKVPDTPTA
jgi:hypothetical protein